MKRTSLKRRTPLRSNKPCATSSDKKRYSTFKQRSTGGYTSLDAVWSEAVRNRDLYCQWPSGCRTGLRLTAHHGIRRDVLEHRHNPDNGICLCIVHHAEAEADPGEWKMTPSPLGDQWMAAGGWFQNGRLTTPGSWRRQAGINAEGNSRHG